MGLIIERHARAALPACVAGRAATAAQTEGPYYPRAFPADGNADLTHLKGRTDRALGQVIFIEGRLVNTSCQPIPNCVVELWQANSVGRYTHPGDNNAMPLDPALQYFARITPRADGSFEFRTILPGLYPGRTRHIHFRVVRGGQTALITQMYFAGEARNGQDGVYQGLSAAARELVTTSLTPMPLDERVLRGTFDIRLGVAGAAFTTPFLD